LVTKVMISGYIGILLATDYSIEDRIPFSIN
jgi:hypothetical protein